jgi:hypothetical protein
MRRFVVAFALLLAAASSAAAGVTGPAFYVDGQLYRTVATPTDLADTGAPEQSWDVIYDLGGSQPNVATAAPGDTDYNGGRWRVRSVSFNTSYEATLSAYDANGNGVLDSDAELGEALADAGPSGATDVGVVRQFVCPVIPLPRS